MSWLRRKLRLLAPLEFERIVNINEMIESRTNARTFVARSRAILAPASSPASSAHTTMQNRETSTNSTEKKYGEMQTTTTCITRREASRYTFEAKFLLAFSMTCKRALRRLLDE